MAKKEKKPKYIESRLHTPMLNYEVYVMSPSEAMFVRAASFVIGGFVGLIFYANLFMEDGVATTATHISNAVVFCVVGFCAVKFLVPMYRNRCLNSRNERLKQQFRDMLEALAASFSSGSNVQNAFEGVLDDLKMQFDETDMIVQEMQEIVNGIHQNIDIAVMLQDFAVRSGNEDIMSFADVFNVCYRKGGDMNSVIRHTHSVISEKMSISDEIETKLTSNKMQHNIMSLMPIALVAMLRLTNDMFAESFTTAVGVIANTVAIGIFVGAYIYGIKIVDIKE